MTAALLGSVYTSLSGIASGTLNAASQAGSVIGVALFGSLAATSLVPRLRPGVATTTTHGDEIVVTAPDVPSRDLVHALVTEGIGVTSVHEQRKSLEEAFLAMTGGDDDHAAR